MNVRAGIVLGAILVALGVATLLHGGPLFLGLGAVHFFSLSIIGFFGPLLARWLNQDVRLRNTDTKPGILSGFLLGFALLSAGRPASARSFPRCSCWPRPATPSPVASFFWPSIPRDSPCPFADRAPFQQFMRFYKNFCNIFTLWSY